jgi:phosphatidate phosphatase PAH1
MIINNDFKTSYNEISDNVDSYFPKIQKEPDEMSTINSNEADLSPKLE